jgi:hypothetical protein
MLKKIRYLLSFILFLFSVTLLVWSFLPGRRQVDVQLLEPSTMRVKSDGQVDGPGLLESRQVRLEWPCSMRIGDRGVISLDFKAVNEDASSSQQQTEFLDTYSNFNIMAEAKFEVAGLKVEPANATRESMPPGQPVRFNWDISAEEARAYRGDVWLSLRFLPLDGSTPIQEPIYVSEVAIQTTSVLGLSGVMARLVGGVGVLLGVLLIINDMMGWMRRWMMKITTKDTRGTKDLQ